MIKFKAFITFLFGILELKGQTSSDSITIVNNSTTLSSYCSGTPLWNANLCNITCSTCVETNQFKCLSCDSNYSLSGTYCLLTNDTYTFIEESYFSSNPIASSDLSQWTEASISKKLTTSNTVSICSSNSYNFQMVGLFGKDEKLNILLSYQNTMSYLTIKFNLLLLINHVSFEIDLEQRPIYSQKFSSLASINATYYSSTSDSSSNYLSIPSLTSGSSRTIIQTISFDTYISTSDINLYFQASGNSNNKFWAVSDIVILLRQCDTCPTAQLTTTINTLGFVTLYTSAFTIPLILIFYCAIKLREYYHRIEFQKKIGGKALPNRAIQRIKKLFEPQIKEKKNGMKLQKKLSSFRVSLNQINNEKQKIRKTQ